MANIAKRGWDAAQSAAIYCVQYLSPPPSDDNEKVETVVLFAQKLAEFGNG